MKVLHVGYALEKASGVTTFVENVVEKLRLAGHEVDVVDAAGVGGTDEERRVLAGISKYDVVHLHCLWQLHAYAKATKAARVPVVFSTHGMTAPWAMRHKWWKKKLAWWLYQGRDLKAAAAIHCTTEQEVEWNRGYGLSKCFVAPLGCELNRIEHVDRAEKVLLFVGRIHPVKGLENLIKAWALVKECEKAEVNDVETCRGREDVRGWKLRIVGPDEGGYLSRLKSEVRSLGLESSVEFAGPKFGDGLSREYESCDCLVLPSFTENFGATVVDAMAHGKPVITSTFTPWREVADRKCGWWVPNEPEVLADAMRQMMLASDDERDAMGERGRRLVKEKYSWSAVAETIMARYDEIRRGKAWKVA